MADRSRPKRSPGKPKVSRSPTQPERISNVQQLDLGKAMLKPDTPVVAGSTITLTYTYTCGHPIDDRGYLKVAFRDVGDFQTPQFDDPAAPGAGAWYAVAVRGGDD